MNTQTNALLMHQFLLGAGLNADLAMQTLSAFRVRHIHSTTVLDLTCPSYHTVLDLMPILPHGDWQQLIEPHPAQHSLCQPVVSMQNGDMDSLHCEWVSPVRLILREQPHKSEPSATDGTLTVD